jgi:CubicO group peptidase (beta-lactamase class C family)
MVGTLGAPQALAQESSGVPNFDSALATAESLPRLRSLLISHKGTVVLERYFHGAAPTDIANVKSVSKSLMSALIGLAIEQGHIEGVDAPISTFLESSELVGTENPKAEITIEDLLTMRSGLETTSNRNYGAWVLSPDWVECALEPPIVAPPGTLMIYSTGNTHLLSAILTAASGMSTLEFARRHLGEPLGFRLAPWPRDPNGIYFGGNDMELTPQQMLSIGEMYMNGGRANGRQVLPRRWIDASFEPHTESTREEGRFYGYGWWLRDMAGYETPYAWGYGGQFILLVPELTLVIVTTSSSQPGPDRRGHTRRIYDLVEHEVIAAFKRAAITAGQADAPQHVVGASDRLRSSLHLTR